jgi:hypothetical protein
MAVHVRALVKSVVVLSLSVQTTPGALPVGFDAKLNGHRVLPETLRERFRTERREVVLPASLELAAGRYVLSADTGSGRSLMSLRLAWKSDR